MTSTTYGDENERSWTGLILIVDDVPTNIKVLADLLKSQYEIRVVNNGKDALKMANATYKPDLIFLDIMMPEMDGYDVCRELKKNEATQDIPVVFITARSGNYDEEHGLSLGAVDYIMKPFVPAIVMARIRNLLLLKTQHDELLRQKEALLLQNEELKKALHEIKTLRGFLPICSSCRKIRDDQGYWSQIEIYLHTHTDAQITHSICPDCCRKLYPEDYAYIYTDEGDIIP
ncbi:MAG: response regulator [Pseudomonadota bacterium]